MAILTDDKIQLPIPFAVPFLGLHEPTSIAFDKSQVQLVVRVLVCLCSVLLFWPKIRAAFGFSAAPSEDQTKEIQERIAKLEHEREKRTGQKNYAVVTGGSSDANTAKTTTNEKEKVKAKKRKV